jgi:hypothetical protein
MSPRRSHSRRDDALSKLQSRVAAFSGSKCVASAVSLAGLILMKCRVPCPRCRDLQAEVDAAAPERERLRQVYDRAHPAPKKPQPTTPDETATTSNDDLL